MHLRFPCILTRTLLILFPAYSSTQSTNNLPSRDDIYMNRPGEYRHNIPTCSRSNVASYLLQGTQNHRLLVSYNATLEVRFGPGVPISSTRHICPISEIPLKLARGWKYAIEKVEMRGQVEIGPKVSNIISTAVLFRNITGTSVFSHRWDYPAVVDSGGFYPGNGDPLFSIPRTDAGAANGHHWNPRSGDAPPENVEDESWGALQLEAKFYVQASGNIDYEFIGNPPYCGMEVLTYHLVFEECEPDTPEPEE